MTAIVFVSAVFYHGGAASSLMHPCPLSLPLPTLLRCRQLSPLSFAADVVLSSLPSSPLSAVPFPSCCFFRQGWEIDKCGHVSRPTTPLSANNCSTDYCCHRVISATQSHFRSHQPPDACCPPSPLPSSSPLPLPLPSPSSLAVAEQCLPAMTVSPCRLMVDRHLSSPSRRLRYRSTPSWWLPPCPPTAIVSR